MSYRALTEDGVDRYLHGANVPIPGALSQLAAIAPEKFQMVSATETDSATQNHKHTSASDT